jgi:hypothetical protein
MGVKAVVLRHDDHDQEMKGVYKILHFAIFVYNTQTANFAKCAPKFIFPTKNARLGRKYSMKFCTYRVVRTNVHLAFWGSELYFLWLVTLSLWRLCV